MGSAEDKGFDKHSFHEESALIPPQKRQVSINTEIRLRKAVIVVSVVSMIAIGALGVLTFVDGIEDESSSCLAFAFNAFLDILSSLVVIWHFWGSGGNSYPVRQEAIVCLILGSFFFLSAIIIMAQSLYGLALVIVPESTRFSWCLSMTNAIVCCVLLVAMIYLAYKLESKVLLTDAFNTAAGLVLAISTLVSEEAYYHDHDIWQIDGIMGVVCSLALIGYGIWIVYMSYHNLQRDKAKSIDATSIYME